MPAFNRDVVSGHSLIAFLLGFLCLLFVPLSILHTARVFGGFALVMLREFKHELRRIRKLLNEIRRQLRSPRQRVK